MFGRRPTPPTSRLPRATRTYWFIVCGALLATAATVAPAQPCQGAPVKTAEGNGKFRLIAQQCAVLDEPLAQHRSAQLELYSGRVASVGVSLPPPGALPPAEAASAPQVLGGPKPDPKPPTKDAQRVISLAPALTDAARAHQLDPLLLHAIAHVESRHNPQAVSKAGARGAMQMMPATARRFGVDDPERRLHDPDTNLRASAAYLRILRDRYGDDLRLVLAAYNAGEGAVERYGRNVPPFAETQTYVRDVLAVYRRLRNEFKVTAGGQLVARGV